MMNAAKNKVSQIARKLLKGWRTCTDTPHRDSKAWLRRWRMTYDDFVVHDFAVEEGSVFIQKKAEASLIAFAGPVLKEDHKG